MDATTNLSLGCAQGFKMMAQKPKRTPLEQVATEISLIGLAVGFSILGTLTIVNRNQADLSGISGGNLIAILGGISAILVGTVFLAATCLYLRIGARRSLAIPGEAQACPVSFRSSPASSSDQMNEDEIPGRRERIFSELAPGWSWIISLLN